MQPQAPANPLGTAPIKSLIWKYAIPGIITQLVSALHNIVDQVFVGWGIGDNGIAATNIVFPLTSVIIALSTLLGIGAAARFSILLGKGEQEGAAKVIGTSISWGRPLPSSPLCSWNPCSTSSGQRSSSCPTPPPTPG